MRGCIVIHAEVVFCFLSHDIEISDAMNGFRFSYLNATTSPMIDFHSMWTNFSWMSLILCLGVH